MLNVLDSHNVDRGRTNVDDVYQSLDTNEDLLYPDDLTRAIRHLRSILIF